MSQPHEEQWTTGEGALSGALCSGDTWIGSFTNPERAKLAVHAPALARHLMKYVAVCTSCDGAGQGSVRSPDGYVRASCPGCEEARAVLRAAGVIP